MAGNHANWKVYSCFHPKNRRLWDELESQLAALKRLDLISVLCDQDILPGQDLQQKVEEFVTTADIILLLISQHFIASDYHWKIALRAQRYNERKAQVVFVALSPILDDERLPIARLPRLPQGKPITCWSNRQEAFVDIVRGVRNLIAREENKEAW